MTPAPHHTCDLCDRVVEQEFTRVPWPAGVPGYPEGTPVSVPSFMPRGWTCDPVDMTTGRVIPFRQAKRHRDRVLLVTVCDACQEASQPGPLL